MNTNNTNTNNNNTSNNNNNTNNNNNAKMKNAKKTGNKNVNTQFSVDNGGRDTSSSVGVGSESQTGRTLEGDVKVTEA
jgi:hypothetical protein